MVDPLGISAAIAVVGERIDSLLEHKAADSFNKELLAILQIVRKIESDYLALEQNTSQLKENNGQLQSRIRELEQALIEKESQLVNSAAEQEQRVAKVMDELEVDTLTPNEEIVLMALTTKPDLVFENYADRCDMSVPKFKAVYYDLQERNLTGMAFDQGRGSQGNITSDGLRLLNQLGLLD